jgi:ribosomal protein S18 acetylase RimI-like enzyme
VREAVLQGVVAAIEANMAAFRSLHSHLPGGKLYEEAGALWYTSEEPHFILNGVYRAQFAPENADERIEQVLDTFRRRGSQAVWWVGPSARPDDLGQRLLAHGLVHHGNALGMAMELRNLRAPSMPGGLKIKVIQDSETLRQYLDVFSLPPGVERAFRDLYVDLALQCGLPWYRFVGVLDGEPVGISEVYLGVGVAGIYGVTTVEWARRRGIGSAVTAAAFLAARAQGYRVGVVIATEAGSGVYQRLGFRSYCELSHYLWEGD